MANSKEYGNVIVVDDCSTDRTSSILKKHNVIVLKNKIRMGYSKSLWVGITKAFDLKFTHVITLDADGEHDANYIRQFSSSFKKYQIIFGVRKTKPRFSEKILGKYFELLFDVGDITCGMKGLDLSIIKNNSYEKINDDLGLSVFNYLLNKKHKFSQIPISGKKRKDSPRFDSKIKANFKILFLFLKIIYVNHFKKMKF